MQVIKIVVGILFVLGALGNLRHIGGMNSAELMGYMGVAMAFFFIGAFLLYSGLKPKPPSISITGDDDD